jgi:hypothetical protein
MNCIEQMKSGRRVYATAAPVPDWVLDLLPDAPYTIRIVY